MKLMINIAPGEKCICEKSHLTAGIGTGILVLPWAHLCNGIHFKSILKRRRREVPALP
jgi:hypothetical protein